LSTTVSMPQLGETVTEGTILKWAKSVGEDIAEDDVLVEISTDKVDTEVPSPVSGKVLEILVPEGETVGVGTPLVVIGDEGEAGDEASPEPESSSDVEEPEPSADVMEPEAEAEAEAEAPSDQTRAGATGEPVSDTEPTEAEVDAFFAEPDEGDRKPNLLSPVVRRLIRENDIDVAALTGTGSGGRITRKDVDQYLASAPAPSEAPAASERPSEPEPTPAETPVTQLEPAPAPPAATQTAPTPALVGETVEMDRLRVRIAENLIKAKQTAAHVWTSVEVDYERVERVRQAHKAEFKDDEGFSLTYLPFISRATIDALKAFPVVNSSFNLEEKTVTYHRNVDLGIAIDLNQGGLVVARVRGADGLRLVGIAREVRALADRAREGKLSLDDLTGSTFTITNPGPFGSFMSAPIINVPNVAILSTETVTKRPTVITTPDGQDMIAIRHIGYLGLSWDHRAFDGSTAVLFLGRIKENLESWDWEQELA